MSLLWTRDRSAPANFQDNYYIYIPNLPAAIVAFVLWTIVLVAIVYRSYRFKIWYLTVMVVGLVSIIPQVVGYILRVYGHFHLDGYNPYVVMQAFTILAPVMFAAANYVIFGRLLHYGHLIYPGKRLTWLPTRHVVAVFVTSDVISFLVQMGGAILLLNKSGNDTKQQAGQNTLMAGLAINLASFCYFFTLVIWFEVATQRIVRRRGIKRSYAPIVYATMFSQFFLICRSIYRVIEFQQGYFSPIATTELYFYLFDTMIMLFATAIYIPFFPPAFGLLGKKRLATKLADEEGAVEMGDVQSGGSHNVVETSSYSTPVKV